MALLDVGERFGRLQVVALVSGPEEEEERYRLRCHQCRSDSVLCNVSALLAGNIRECFDCAEQAKLTPAQRVAIAFRRSLQMSPSPLLDWLTVEAISQEMTIAQALSEAA